MVCKDCGSDLKGGSRFCAECGADQGGTVPVLTAASDPRLGTTIAGKYRLDAKIGTGGMATVYRATRLLIGDAVAVKILHAEQLRDARAPERFRREAQAAARLKHPNAVIVHDFGTFDDGLVYLVMELVEGQSLRKLIKEQGPLLPSAVAEILKQACGALNDAHQQNVVHRDIKPDNIIVGTVPAGLRVKVLDFGIARIRDMSRVGNLTQTGSVMGTPHYMSPEQCLGEELDGRSDIYSLGIVLYEMLTGVVPFNSPTSMAVVIQHVNTPPAPVRILNASISPMVEAVVMRTLEKRREARPQTAAALAEEFGAAVEATTPPLGNLSAHVVTASSAQAMMQTAQMQTPWSTGATMPPQGEAPWTPTAAREGGESRRRQPVALIGSVAALVVVGALFAWSFASRTEKPDSNASIPATPIPPSSESVPANSAPVAPPPVAAAPPAAADDSPRTSTPRASVTSKSTASSGRAEASRSPGPTQSERPYEPSDTVSMPELIRHADPEYTSNARNARIQGSVQIGGTVDLTGRLVDIEVVKPLSRWERLNEEVISRAQEWRFNPGRLVAEDRPVPVRVTIEILVATCSNCDTPMKILFMLLTKISGP